MAEKISQIMAKTMLKYDDTKIMDKILSTWDFWDDSDDAWLLQAKVAQVAEQLTRNEQVYGSKPYIGST